MLRSSDKIDSKADTVIVTKNLNTSFAPWSLAEVGEATTKFAHKSTVKDSTFRDAN
jgi:hypothetical protein